MDPNQGVEQKPNSITPDAASTIDNYNQLGQQLRRANTLSELGQQLSKVAEIAEALTLRESDDWFDAHTVKRNMKEIKKYADDFNKYAKEADTLHQRITALYDDMGHGLQRYFNIKDIASEEGPVNVAGPTPPPNPSEPEIKESAPTASDKSKEEKLLMVFNHIRLQKNPWKINGQMVSPAQAEQVVRICKKLRPDDAKKLMGKPMADILRMASTVKLENSQ
jgi:hypothetical protein